MKNTLKGDELFEVINPEGILTEIPDDFIENSEVELNSDQNSENSNINSDFDQDSEADTSDHLSILESDFEAPDENSQKSEIDPNLGVTKIKWRITRTLKPKPPPPPSPPRIESSNFESIQFDPSLYGGENFESENERQNVGNTLNQTLETMVSESDLPESEDYTVDVDDSILEEESVLYTKPYIKLRVDWMW